MYALLVPLLFGQCGPNGCSIPPVWPQRPPVVDRTAWQPAVFDIEAIPPDAEVWFDSHAVRLLGGKTRIKTPPLEPARRYQYRVTARWGDTQREWLLSFSPGQTVRVVLRQEEAEPNNSATSDSPALDATDRTASPEGPAPASKPEGLPMIEQDGVQNFGIDRSGLDGSAERITLDGHPISRAEATRILQAGGLADDSGKLRLTVIGTEPDRRRVVDDLKGPLADIAHECLVQDYPPDHWAVAKAGFYTAGKPTIYVQAPDGTVLHRQDDYADGAEGLRQAFERLRTPDPNYRPDKDRDLRRPADGLLARLIDLLARPFRVILSWLLAAGVVFVLIVLAAKGWLIYLLGLVASLVPGPPTQANAADGIKRQPTKRRLAQQRVTKARARR